MLKITKPNENRVDLELSGSLTADEMREGLDDLIAWVKGTAEASTLKVASDCFSVSKSHAFCTGPSMLFAARSR